MSLVTASIDIAASPQQIWDVIMDPRRLGDWVTIHRRLVHADPGPVHEGFQMEQMLHLRGVNIDVRWRLVECRPNVLAVWEGHGPARSSARTEYRISPASSGAHFDYRNEFRAPLGIIGALASRALVGGIPEREAKLTLTRLGELLAPPA
jgi:hypothetical protein